MTIFDCQDRCDLEPARNLVGKFDYLNTSARPAAERVRTLVDRWVTEYPREHRTKPVNRIRSRDDTRHLSAVFELSLHALLKKRGFSIVDIEPTMPNGTQPDFLVQAHDGSQFYLEATLANRYTDQEIGAQRRLNAVLDSIDSIESENFFLHLKTRGTPNSPVRLKKLKSEIQSFVDGLDYLVLIEKIRAGNRKLPHWKYNKDGLSLFIQAVPKNSPKPGRAIGARNLPGGIVTAHQSIRNSIDRKSGKYGDLELPLIIAVNCLDEYANNDQALDAIFGTEVVVVNQETGEHHYQRNPDGAWNGPAGPQNTKCSALLLFSQLTLWSIAQRSGALFRNPWAANELPAIPLGVNDWAVQDGKLVQDLGNSLGEIFDLGADWPKDD